jgi:N-acyl-D-amino-acid deacylase
VFDLVLAGGMVLDGTGAPAERVDVGVRDGRIAALGNLSGASAGTVLDVTGRYVAPGFIDAHAHGDAAVLTAAVQLATLRQGVTTLVLGQDGLSYAPATPAAVRYVTRYFAAINGTHPDLDDGPLTVADLAGTWRGTTAVNTAYLIPAGTIRYSTLGGAPREPEPDELAHMRTTVERGLSEGAAGLSTGLEYLPGRYAKAAELAELCRPVAAATLPYVTHMRGYGRAAGPALAEALEVGQASGAAVHVSHYHGPGTDLVSMVDSALASDVDISFDTYPYLRSCTILALSVLPHWLEDTDLDRTVEALHDPDVRARLVASWPADLWPRVTFAHVPDPRWAWIEGLVLPDAAATAGLDPAQLVLDVLIATGLRVSAVVEQPSSVEDEDSLRLLLGHRVHMGGSDGIYIGAHGHPRGWGAFARYLARYVRELADWTWPSAAVHLAARPARRFGLTDRGLVQPGYAADLAVIDPHSVTDVADYTQSRQPAQGVADVIVNGIAVLRDGELTGALAGTFLRPYPGR